MIPATDVALIEDTIRGFPSRDLIRSRANTWTTEHIDYALERLPQFTHSTHQSRAEAFLLELRADIARSEFERAAAARQAGTDAALAELLRAVEKGPRPHWTQSIGFWVSVIAATAAIIAAWPVFREWLQ